MINSLYIIFMLTGGLGGIICFISLVIWFVLYQLYAKEIRPYFDSPDFPYRYATSFWPFGGGTALNWGLVLLFPNSRYVRKWFPHAREMIRNNPLPSKLRRVVLFHMYTVWPAGIVCFVAGGISMAIDKFL